MPLEVVARAPRSADPLIVRGFEEAYGDTESAFAQAVSRATASWAERRRSSDEAQHGGWTLLVEITAIDAELASSSRMMVSMTVRATLRARRGNAFLGQTQAGCREGGPPQVDHGRPVVLRCFERVAVDLAGWLDSDVANSAWSGLR
jgi:hypothetical protein